ncbi:16S rRNA (adenine(1518)-N(6)/adenine(1519)-N(6))-dimethyltransferase RsmA [Canibacter zhuwentaonis]|uniref:16S rRNA (adenine(1518)-N(6)/adenine(1519)-N(6))- dimethyltransferase RsmA n=1 Tax=Canibacter zhuwentaonis TaxID=2837491 RepID=UPI0032B39FDA
MSDTRGELQELLTPALIRQLATRLEVIPTKKLGQNFVHDANTVRKIVLLSQVQENTRVLEIGPGLGSLTLGLTATGAQVTAVEIDPKLAAQLPLTVAELQPVARLEVMHCDALNLTDLSHSPETLVANLPYNVSVPILMHLLQTFASIRRALVMVQYEVGERIAAAPKSKAYGAPSVKAAWYGNWSLAGAVSRNIFWPVPGVDSVLVSFAKNAVARGSEAERELTFALIEAAFGQRRKMLRQSLRAFSYPQTGLADPSIISCATEIFSSSQLITELCQKCQIDSSARAEELSVADFHALARSVLTR